LAAVPVTMTMPLLVLVLLVRYYQSAVAVAAMDCL
jgi:hypothetical protein